MQNSIHIKTLLQGFYFQAISEGQNPMARNVNKFGQLHSTYGTTLETKLEPQ